MAYSIISASTPEALVVAVDAYIAANPTYEAIGSPVYVSVSYFVQAVAEIVGGGSGGGGITNITWAALLALYNAGTMVAGTFYNITDNPQSVGIIVQAVSTSRLSMSASGLFLNPDFQAVGDYSGVLALTGVAFTGVVNLGCYNELVSRGTIVYDTEAGGVFSVGDTITQLVSGATGEIVSKNATEITFYSRNGIDFDAVNSIGNGLGVTANVTGSTPPTWLDGNIVFWYGFHYQIIDKTAYDGTDPATNVVAFQVLSKTTSNMGYILVCDDIQYNIVTDSIITRQSSNRNKVGYGYQEWFQWGNNNVADNNFLDGYAFTINQRGYINGSSVINGGTLTANDGFYGSVYNTEFSGGGIMTFDEGGSVTNCRIRSQNNFVFAGVNVFTGGVFDSGVSTMRSLPIDITGLAVLNLNGLPYLGIVNVTSTNATESISSFTDCPQETSFRIYPEPGLVLTIVHGIGAGEPRCEGGVNAVLDGSKGDWIELEMDINSVYYQKNIGTY